MRTAFCLFGDSCIQKSEDVATDKFSLVSENLNCLNFPRFVAFIRNYIFVIVKGKLPQKYACFRPDDGSELGTQNRKNNAG